MDNKRIDYLKRHLEQSLSERNYNEVNSYYQELVKISDPDEIADITKEVSHFNSQYIESEKQLVSHDYLRAKDEVYEAANKYKKAKKSFWISFFGGFGLFLFGFLIVLLGSVIDDAIMTIGLVIVIIGGVILFSGLFFTMYLKKTFTALQNCQAKMYELICQTEFKTKYISNVDKIETPLLKYQGQLIADEKNGFGVGLLSSGMIYVGEWKENSMEGIGKLYSDDMSMVLEGEFLDNNINGIVDVIWDDGNEWHGEYKNGVPWNGQGKTLVKNRVQEGIWRNGIKAQ